MGFDEMIESNSKKSDLKKKCLKLCSKFLQLKKSCSKMDKQIEDDFFRIPFHVLTTNLLGSCSTKLIVTLHTLKDSDELHAYSGSS